GWMRSSNPRWLADRNDASTSALRSLASTSSAACEARLSAAALIAPIVAPGNANVALWLSNPNSDITIEPNPYALRSVTCNFSVVAAVWAANMRAPLRSTPVFSERLPGSMPGLSARKTIGRWNESATVMKWAALSAASASMEPASTLGWFATTATGWPPRWASAQMI